MDQRLARIRGTTQLADAADADLFIAAVFEDMALKQQLFRDLDAIAKPGAILATNTTGWTSPPSRRPPAGSRTWSAHIA